MSDPPFELYSAPIDGSRCLRSAGRLRRLKLPLPADPPVEGPPAACFLCHPERDRLDLGAWPSEDGALRVLGNAHPFADRALLVAPAGEAFHLATPATLPATTLAELLAVPFDAAFLARFELGALALAAFFNVGRRAAQSRRHPHLQLVAFDRARGPLAAGDVAALVADLGAADAEERALPLGGGVRAIVPRQPALTGEIWLPLPSDAVAGSGPALQQAATALSRVCAATVRGWSGDYNVVLRLEAPALVRVLPRGLSERAGLEFSAPALLGGVVAVTARESVLLWRGALDAGGSAPD